MTPAPSFSCQTCVFFSPYWRNPETGQCRAHAPVLVMTEAGPKAQWPLTRSSMWCGDHAVPDTQPQREETDQ